MSNFIKYRIREELPQDGGIRLFFPEMNPTSDTSKWYPINDFMGDRGVCKTFEFALKTIKRYQEEMKALPKEKIYNIGELTPESFENHLKNYVP